MTALFLRLLHVDVKAAALAKAVAAFREGHALNPTVHLVDPASFRQVPGSPFAYWVSERIRRLFTELPPFEGDGWTVKVGLQTSDDFRFVRATWEVPAAQVGSRWWPFAKGGAYSPFYADVHLVVNWADEGSEIRDFIDLETGKTYSRPHNLEYYFRPGLTWPRRTNGLSFRVMTRGCIFVDKGPAAFVDGDEPDSLIALAALVNSKPFGYLVNVQLARTELAQSFEVGLIQQTPVPKLTTQDTRALTTLSRRAWSLKRDLDTVQETSHAFLVPALLQVSGNTLAKRIAAWQARIAEAERQLAEYQREIDHIAFRLYGIDGEDRRAIEEGTRDETAGIDEEAEETEADD